MLRYTKSRAQSIANFFIVFLQLITVGGFSLFVIPGGGLEEVSESLYPESPYLMDNIVLDSLLSYPVLALVFCVFAVCFVKAHRIDLKSKKIVFNLIVLLCFASLNGAVIHMAYYVPITESAVN